MDYKKIGFKSGLEVHRQLDTNKLFCSCPSLVNDPNQADINFKRILRTSQSELGEVDKAALHEFKKNKFFKYEATSHSSCLVEYDEEPPHNLNQEALRVAIQVAKTFNASVVDELQVMRKVVIDGSNVSSFQRTILVAINGYIETSKGKVKIPLICLEEEAAKKVQTELTFTKYRLDRLGIPLLEITTDASLQDPDHVKETASLIGMALKSTGNVKGGIGSVRQDINLSIKGSSRIEIKGFQDLRVMPKVIINETNRLISLKESKPEVRKINTDLTTEFLRPMPGSARMYPETDIRPIKITQSLLSSIKKPELISDKVSSLEKKYNIDKNLAEELVKKEINLDPYLKKYKNIESKKLIEILINVPKEVKSRFKIKISQENLEQALTLLDQGKINIQYLVDVLNDLHNNKFDINKYKQVDLNEIEQDIKKIKQENKGASLNALMGIVMKKYGGKVNPKDIATLLKKEDE
jgi:Glu-tRNA(Gln) amidotransferase subunit E-like FAD-binding protein